jgi:hypothetical protein
VSIARGNHDYERITREPRPLGTQTALRRALGTLDA